MRKKDTRKNEKKKTSTHVVQIHERKKKVVTAAVAVVGAQAKLKNVRRIMKRSMQC